MHTPRVNTALHRRITATTLAVLSLLTSAALGQGPIPKGDPGKKMERSLAAKISSDMARSGWKQTETPAPDFRLSLIEADTLLANPARAKALFASAALRQDAVDDAALIARKTNDPELRQAAIQSIGRVPTAKAQAALIDLYKAMEEPAARLTIVGGLSPAREDDPVATLLFQELAKPGLSPALRTAMVRTLAGLAVRRFGKQGDTAPASITSRLPAGVREQLTSAFTAIRGGAKSAPKEFTGLQPIQPSPLTAEKIAAFVAALKERRSRPHTVVRKVDANGEVVAAPAGEGGQPGTYRQVLIVPTGYTADEHEKFFADVEKMISKMGNLPDPVYTRKHRNRLLYVIRWMPGAAMSSGSANFGGTTYTHPTRGGLAMTLKNAQVIAAVQNLRQTEMPTLDPIGVIVLFNFDGEATAYASPPTLLRQKFGIARITRDDIDRYRGRPMHELAHASLNFLDEYIEPALLGKDVTDFDALTPAILPDGSWGSLRDSWESLIGNYEIKLSDILGDNGSENISTRKQPNTVTSSPSVYTPLKYEFEGGMFFNFGTFHDSGNNVMNNDKPTAESPLKPDGDRHAFDHSPAQKMVLGQVFGEHGTPRPNDRIRNAGPTIDWLPQLGSNVRLLIFDADKNHRWHPTTKYQVEVGWYEWVYQGTLFDPLKGEWKWRTMTREFDPSSRTVDLSKTFAAGGAGLLRDVLVELGVTELGDGGFNLGAASVNDLLNQAIPSVVWPMPYQDVEVPLSVPNRYYWRFRTYNGTHWSAFTEYSAFTKV